MESDKPSPWRQPKHTPEAGENHPQGRVRIHRPTNGPHHEKGPQGRGEGRPS